MPSRKRNKGKARKAKSSQARAKNEGATAGEQISELQSLPDSLTTLDQTPRGASCWICLEEGPDESNQPLVRDCSCRGSDSGFGHLACIVKNAKHKSANTSEREGLKFIEPWRIYPNCNQRYQRDLADDLATECIEFVKSKYTGCLQRLLAAYHMKLGSSLLCGNTKEAEEVAYQCLNLVEQVNMGHGQAQQVLMESTILGIEGDVYSMLGAVAADDDTRESAEKAIKYFERSISIFRKASTFSSIAAAADTEAKVAMLKAKYNENESSHSNDEAELIKHQQSYQLNVDIHGDEHPSTITSGERLAEALEKSYRVIEAERLLKGLVAVSRRVYGAEHDLTSRLEKLLERVATRFVMIMYHGAPQRFRALGYVCGGEKCVIQGPLKIPRSPDEEMVLTVDTEEVHPTLGVPVICHGLKNASYLNGKIGEIRSLDDESGRYGVHFEDASIEAKLVKRENLRILFELPDECMESYDDVD